MALKLTITDTAALLPAAVVPRIVLYVKLGGINFNAITNAATLPLTYRQFDEQTGQPVGDWLHLPLPSYAELLLPRQLMMDTTKSPYTNSYEAAAEFLRNICGAAATVESLD